MTLKQTMDELKSLGDEKWRQACIKRGADENCYGVKSGDLRVLAKKIKTDPELAAKLWETGNSDAMALSILIMKPKEVSATELEKMVKVATYTQLADWLASYVLKVHPEKESLRQKWMKSKDVMLSRAGWYLTALKVGKEPADLDIPGLLDRIEKEMGKAPAPSQWTMNTCLAAIGIEHPEHRERAIAIGEKLGVLRDYPTSKGCTSPYAPIWIAEMVRRQG